MADENVRLALRVHDEVSLGVVPSARTARLFLSNPDRSATEVMCSVLTSAHVGRISFTESKKQLKKHKKAAVAWSFTSAKRAGPWVKSQR